MKRVLFAAVFLLYLLTAQNCTGTAKKSKADARDLAPDPIYTPIALPPSFNDYWYQGKAELCTYDVEQERYGEMRKGEQVNVFVTEDFSRSKQVKLDNPQQAGPDRIPILKMNSIRRFETGIYDYSLMQSIFTPTSGMSTAKATATVQDWCGQVFIQANLNPGGYQVRVFSYFENEGDQDLTLPQVFLEDEIWNRIRLNPAAIKTGKMQVVPSFIYSRLRHQPIAPQEADIQVIKGDSTVSFLILNYQKIPRSLQISFESVFPYKILAWEETNESKLTSRGKLKATRRSAYWTEHDNIHAPLRDSIKVGHKY